MISKDQFIERVRKEVFPDLMATDWARKKALVKGFFFVALAGGLLVLAALNPSLGDNDWFWAGFAACIMGAGYIWREFVKQTKKKVSPVFLKLLGDLKLGQDVINASLLRHTCLFPKFDYERYDDCFSGTFENTQFSVAELKLWVNGGKSDYSVFSGVCIDIPMKLPTSGYTLLFNSSFPKRIGPLQRITLEDVSFGKNYQVYSDNQIDARVLLTPAFMEKLNNMRRCFHNKNIDVAFFGNHAVFVIHTAANLFESYSLFRKVTNTRTYEKFYDEIAAIHDMISVLSINNESMPKTVTFNKGLYEQITAAKENHVAFGIFLGIFVFFLFLLIIPIMLGAWEAGLIFGTFFIISGVAMLWFWPRNRR